MQKRLMRLAAAALQIASSVMLGACAARQTAVRDSAAAGA